MTSGALLTCKGVDVAYDKVQVLFGVDVEIEEGEIVALLGTNGAGKSTLLRAVSGLTNVASGSIHFDGVDITDASAVDTARLGIVHVPGGRAVFPTLTIRDHFTTSGWLYRSTNPAEIAARIEQILDTFPRLRERWDQLAGNLSGGEQQQLALGMAFVAKPRLLIIDELSLGLAPTVVRQLLEIVRTIHAEGATVLLVEQSVNLALTIATRAYFMDKGEVRFAGATADLLGRDDILRSVFLQGATDSFTPATPTVHTKPRVARASSEEEEARSQPVLDVRALSKHFGGIQAVSDVSFVAHEQEILGFIGPNGAGKTTVFDLLCGHLSPDTGQVVLGTTDITSLPAYRRSALGLGRSFQDARIFPTLTVEENIAVGLERHVVVRDHVSALFASPAMRESEADVAFTVDDLVGLLGLGAYRNKFVSELSTGSRRIVELAMAIAHNPTVLLLDEPSSGIAQRETEQLGPLLLDIRRETGCALLVIEHDMALISAISDEIIALDLGSVIVQGKPAAVLSHPRVVASYLGTDPTVLERSGTAKPRRRPARAS